MICLMPRRRSAAYNFRKDAPTRRNGDAPNGAVVRWCAVQIVFLNFSYISVIVRGSRDHRH